MGEKGTIGSSLKFLNTLLKKHTIKVSRLKLPGEDSLSGSLAEGEEPQRIPLGKELREKYKRIDQNCIT